MCNSYRQTRPLDEIAALFAQGGLPLVFPEGAPNVEAREMVRITDAAPVVRRGAGGAYELVQRRWSWPGPGGKPVYNFRAEGRRFLGGRCLAPVEGFYEYTGPEPGMKRKTRWLFTRPGEPVFALAALLRATPDGEAFALLTVEPGPDVAPYHARSVIPLDAAAAKAWLDGAPEREILRPPPSGTLQVARG